MLDVKQSNQTNMKEATGQITNANAWNKYTPEDHTTWSTLFKHQTKLLEDRAYSKYLVGLKLLHIPNHQIPKFDEINKQLIGLTGWTIAPVTELIPGRLFFELLSQRRFPVGTFIRKPNQLDYIEEPDVFHDLFGHVPILSHPVFANFMEKFGHVGVQAIDKGFEVAMTRLYWFTVEFGLIKDSQGLSIYGGGILSSKGETIFSLDSDVPNRIEFDPVRIMRSKFRIDEYQKNYFVINSFEELFDSISEGWEALCKDAQSLGDIEDGAVVDTDRFIQKEANSKCNLSLKDQKCMACHGGIPALKGEELQSFLKKLDENWTINSLGRLERNFKFKDFQQPMLLANKIAKLADHEEHHPDLHISWEKCRVEIWTHKINGLSESDFILAAKIDALN